MILMPLLRGSLETLGRRYIERTLADVGRLHYWLMCLPERPAESLARIAKLAHSIQGSAASFGFGAVGASAGAIERLVRSSSRSPATPVDAALTRDLLRRVEDLARLVAHAAESVPAAAAVPAKSGVSIRQ